MIIVRSAENWIGGESFLKLLNRAVDEVCNYFGLDKYNPNLPNRPSVKFNFDGLGFNAVPTYEVIQEPIINELIHSQFRPLSQLPSVKLLIEVVHKVKDILEVNQEPEKSQRPQGPDGFEEWTVWYLLLYTLKEIVTYCSIKNRARIYTPQKRQNKIVLCLVDTHLFRSPLKPVFVQPPANKLNVRRKE